jgi:hypothetical protein
MKRTETSKNDVRVTSAPKKNVKIPEQKIRERAFEIYLHRRGNGDNTLEDWLRAENELRQTTNQNS